jgi:hypothetical protein
MPCTRESPFICGNRARNLVRDRHLVASFNYARLALQIDAADDTKPSCLLAPIALRFRAIFWKALLLITEDHPTRHTAGPHFGAYRN